MRGNSDRHRVLFTKPVKQGSERPVNLRFRHDELAEQISGMPRRLVMIQPVITPAKIEKLALLLQDKLDHGRPDLRQAYARLRLSEVRLNDRGIRISGSKSRWHEALQQT